MVTFKSRKPMAFTATIDFYDDRGNRYPMPVSGVTDSSLLSTVPYLKAKAGELELMAAPGAAPCAVPQGTDRKQALTFLRPLLRPAKGRGGGNGGGAGRSGRGSAGSSSGAGVRGGGSRGRRASGEDPSKKGGSKSYVGSVPNGPDGQLLPPDMGMLGHVDEEETELLRLWLNAVLLKSPLEHFPRSITETAGAPIWDLVEALAGSKLPGRGKRSAGADVAGGGSVASSGPGSPGRRRRSRSRGRARSSGSVAERGGAGGGVSSPDQLPRGGKARTLVLYQQSLQALTFLKAHGALLHHIRPEDLLPRDDFVRARMAPGGIDGRGLGAPMLEYRSLTAEARKRKSLRQEYPEVSTSAWAWTCMQIVRVFVLQRVTLQSLAQVPGMHADAACQRATAAIEDARRVQDEERARIMDERRKRRGGAGGQEEQAGDPLKEASTEMQQLVVRTTRRAFAPDRLLAPSNVMAVSELVLLRWAQYHHNQVFTHMPRRVVDPHRDLRDGTVVAGILRSHCPFLGEEGQPLAGFKACPEGPEDLELAWGAIYDALELLDVRPPVPLRELFLGPAPDGIDGEWVGLRRVQEARERVREERKEQEAARIRAVAAAAEFGGGADDAMSVEHGSRGGGARAADGAGEGKTGEQGGEDGSGAANGASTGLDLDGVLPPEAAPVESAIFDTGGVLAHSLGDRARMGEGHTRLCLLALLHLYRTIPQLVPRQTIRFDARMGEKSMRSIELSNPSNKAVIYEVTVAAEPGDEGVFEATTNRVTLPPGQKRSLQVVATARLSRPARARLTLRSQRNGPVQAMTLVFALQTRVLERPPAEVVHLQTPMYKPVEHELQVTNPFDREGKFRVRLIPIPPAAPEGRNVPTYDEDEHGAGAVSGAGVDLNARRAAASGAGAAIAGPGSARPGSQLSHGSGSVGRATSPARVAGIQGRSRPGSSARAAQAQAELRREEGRMFRVGEWARHRNEAGPLTADGYWPAPFHLRTPSQVLHLGKGRSRVLGVQFLPFVAGPHACAVELVDETLGEVVYEVRATAGLPESSGTLKAVLTDDSSSSAAVDEEELAKHLSLRVVGASQQLKEALQEAGRRLPKEEREEQAREQEKRLVKERQRLDALVGRLRQIDPSLLDPSMGGEQEGDEAGGPGAGLRERPSQLLQGGSVLTVGSLSSMQLGSTGGGGGRPSDALTRAGAKVRRVARYLLRPWTYQISIDSPFYRADGAISPGWQDFAVVSRMATRKEQRDAEDRANRLGATETGAVLAAEDEDDDAATAAQRGGEAAAWEGVARVSILPKAPGKYPARLVLASRRETRVYDLDVALRAPPLKRELTLRCPAGARVEQPLPVVNQSKEQWLMRCELRVLEVKEESMGEEASQLFGSDAKSPREGRQLSPRGHHFEVPSTFLVNPGETASIPLKFKPDWTTVERARLIVRNQTRPKMPHIEYVLTGIGEAPAAEGTLKIECSARETVVKELPVTGFSAAPATLRVESDLIGASGDPSLALRAGDTDPRTGKSTPAEGGYELTFAPLAGGLYRGTVRFVDDRSGRFRWWAVEAEVKPPAPEDTLELRATVRKAARVRLQIDNPLDEPVEFQVALEGKGLVGDPVLALAPREQDKVYELLYCPLQAGKGQGAVTFTSERAG